jgi:hypothetical protein
MHVCRARVQFVVTTSVVMVNGNDCLAIARRDASKIVTTGTVSVVMTYGPAQHNAAMTHAVVM